MLKNAKLIAVIILATLMAVGLYRIKALTADNERLGARAEALEADNERLSGELESNRAALTTREEARLGLAAETNELKFRLGEVYEKDTLAADWNDADMPDAVIAECLLEALSTADPARVAACGLPAGSARTTAAR